MTQIELIILSILYEKEGYGYEIEAIIKERNIRYWTDIGFSSIYNSLNKLEKKQWITSRVMKGSGAPNRKIYQVIEDTKIKLRLELKHILSHPNRMHNMFDVAMAFSYLLSQQELVESLEEYRRNLKEQIKAVISTYSKMGKDSEIPHIKALFYRPLAIAQAELKWVESFLLEIQEEC